MTRLPPAQPTEALPFLGRYQLQKKIAVGGMAELYLAHASGAGGFTKQVVVKRILPQLAESEELFAMFLDEARIAATLQHANIVQVYDACEDDGEFFMAMEYLDGTDLRTLRRVLANSNMAIGWEHSLHIVSSIASGLHYAHQKCALDGTPLRIVHRDVSPQNIFLTREGSVKLVDFGIAKAEGRTTETAMGTLKGKLAYMAPEQCASESLDHRADIYSLGVILYELTTGRRLYSSKTEYQLINEIVEGEIRVPSTFMEYPAELERIVLRCLKKDPTERYESARDIQADLNVFARDYQLICSTLGFSIFIEPLLEQARLDAEERFQHRKEIRPIRVKGSQLRQAPEMAELTTLRDSWAPSFEAADEPTDYELDAPATVISTNPAAGTFVDTQQKPDRADEIIEDFLSAKHKVAPPRRPRGTSTPLAIDTRYISGKSNVLEDLTRPVPSDMLERIRREERERSLGDHDSQEADAVPRLARGSFAGDVSVSTNVVRRESTRGTSTASVVVDGKHESRAASIVAPAQTIAPVIARVKTPAPPVLPARATVLPAQADQARIATALVAPAEFALVADESLSLKPKRSKLWLVGALVGSAGIAAALLLGKGSDTPHAAESSMSSDKPLLGSLTVQATAEAKVWLLLGQTPLQNSVVHGQESLHLRIEHDGYQRHEIHLGPETWQRDFNGVQVAEAEIPLLPQEVPGATASPVQAFEATAPAKDGSFAEKLRIRSTPTGADAWLYVGATPNVAIAKLKTSEAVSLRIEQEGQLPMYRTVAADKFDGHGRAALHLILPAAKAKSATEDAVLPLPTIEQNTDAARPAALPAVQAKPRWRPKRTVPGSAAHDGSNAGGAKANVVGPAKATGASPAKATGASPAKATKLQAPVPDWAK